MSSQGNSALTLADLPMDIIRRIIYMEDRESKWFPSQALISRRWQFCTRQVLEVDLDRLMFYIDDRTISQYIHSVFVTRCFRSPRKTIPGGYWGTDNAWRRKGSELDNRAVKIIQRCSGINVFELSNLKAIDPEICAIFRQYIGDKPIKTLAITKVESFLDNNRTLIVDFMKNNAVQHFHLDVSNIDPVALKTFINDAMQFIQSIKIKSPTFLRQRSEECFGHSKQFWLDFTEELNNAGSVHAQFFPDDDETQSGGFHAYNCLRFLITRHKKPLSEETDKSSTSNCSEA